MVFIGNDGWVFFMVDGLDSYDSTIEYLSRGDEICGDYAQLLYGRAVKLQDLNLQDLWSRKTLHKIFKSSNFFRGEYERSLADLREHCH